MEEVLREILQELRKSNQLLEALQPKKLGWTEIQNQMVSELARSIEEKAPAFRQLPRPVMQVLATKQAPTSTPPATGSESPPADPA